MSPLIGCCYGCGETPLIRGEHYAKKKKKKLAATRQVPKLKLS